MPAANKLHSSRNSRDELTTSWDIVLKSLLIVKNTDNMCVKI